MSVSVERGISLRELDAIWKQNGGKIVHLRRTGEKRYHHPATGKKSGCHNARRKDAPVRLVSFVRSILDADVAASRREQPQSVRRVPKPTRPSKQRELTEASRELTEASRQLASSRPGAGRKKLGLADLTFHRNTLLPGGPIAAPPLADAPPTLPASLTTKRSWWTRLLDSLRDFAAKSSTPSRAVEAPNDPKNSVSGEHPELLAGIRSSKSSAEVI